MSGVYSIPFSLWPAGRHEYKACYEWRKVARVHEVWSQLPNELIEMIAQHCIVYVVYQPSGSCNMSRITEFRFAWNELTRVG